MGHILIDALRSKAAAEKNIIECYPTCFSKQRGESNNTYTPGKRKRERKRERGKRKDGNKFMLRLFVSRVFVYAGGTAGEGEREGGG